MTAYIENIYLNVMQEIDVIVIMSFLVMVHLMRLQMAMMNGAHHFLVITHAMKHIKLLLIVNLYGVICINRIGEGIMPVQK